MEKPDPSIILFRNGRLLREHKIEVGELWVQQGKIVAPQKRATRVIDAKGHIIAPGYIDLQINGGFGIDFTREPEKIDRVVSSLPRTGVTGFLPTIVSTSAADYKKILCTLRYKMMHQTFGGQKSSVSILKAPFLIGISYVHTIVIGLKHVKKILLMLSMGT